MSLPRPRCRSEKDIIREPSMHFPVPQISSLVYAYSIYEFTEFTRRKGPAYTVHTINSDRQLLTNDQLRGTGNWN